MFDLRSALVLAACIYSCNAFMLPSSTPLLRAGAPSAAVSGVRAAPAVAALRMGLKSGPAPAFDLPSSDDKTVSLSGLKGKWTVMWFYPKAFTSGCTCQAEDMQKEAAEIKKLNAEIFGVSVDPVDKLKEFSKCRIPRICTAMSGSDAYSLSFPLLSDEGGKVASAYESAIKIPFIGAVANRQTFIINPQGEIAYTFEGVKPQGHGQAVIAKLKELQK